MARRKTLSQGDDGQGKGSAGVGGAGGNVRGDDPGEGTSSRGRRAVKGGLYAPGFSAEELTDLAFCQQDSLDDEIALLRIAIRRAFANGADIAVVAKGVDALGRALKVRYGLRGRSAKGLEEALARALDEIGNELGMVL